MTPVTIPVPDRHALYYPRIHFHDLEWLKATLLAFGHVHRIVPVDHPLAGDPQEVRAISERHGCPAPLVHEIDPDWGVIEMAQGRLFHVLDHLGGPGIVERFGRVQSARREVTARRFTIHRSKFHLQLLDHLERYRLAWPLDGDPQFVGVHPDLGEAIMGVTAIAAARGKGCDVVTESGALHAALGALDEHVLLESILFGPTEGSPLPADRATARVAHAVFTAHFDLSAVSFSDVAGLVNDGVDLRAFRASLAPLAQRLPPELDATERDRRVHELSGEVIAAWVAFQRSLPARLRGALGTSGGEVIERVTADMVANLATAGIGGALAAAAGLTPLQVLAVVAAPAVPVVFALVRAGMGWRREGAAIEPHRYLSKVTARGGVLVARAQA